MVVLLPDITATFLKIDGTGLALICWISEPVRGWSTAL